ncbi:peptidoglycan-binding protein [Telmatospirillum sp. J64-1]|uniref:peptidoglycan-binding domain-containing protein n=1 Tax=Telmatospirillum sp. J64-1 TaxID=2502183 RepID=UPI001C8F5457|nr:peptidoglycan-binding domain-containing protein [Telmatospirillum sp. J64-1]
MKGTLSLAAAGLILAGTAYAAGMEQHSGSQVQQQGGQQQTGQVSGQQQALHPEMVSQVQAQLQQQGYNVGPIDGIWGPQTRSALMQFQADRGLPVTGQLEPQTLASISQGGSQVGQTGQVGGQQGGFTGQQQGGVPGFDEAPPAQHYDTGDSGVGELGQGSPLLRDTHGHSDNGAGGTGGGGTGGGTGGSN